MSDIKLTTEKGIESAETKLLKNRIVMVFGELNDKNVCKIISSLLYLQAEDEQAPIKLYINSVGGPETEGLAVYDVMRHLTCPVHTFCLGKAHGSAALILAGGEKGNRCAYAHSEIMLNQIERDRTFGQASDIERETEHLLASKQRMNQLFASHCGKTESEICADTERKYWLFADQALNYGLIDQIID